LCGKAKFYFSDFLWTLERALLFGLSQLLDKKTEFSLLPQLLSWHSVTLPLPRLFIWTSKIGKQRSKPSPVQIIAE